MRQILLMPRRIIADQRGSVINIALLILILLTLLGITFVELSSTDIKVAGNDRTTKMAFYAAEAARGYVAASPSLYDGTNVASSQPKSFPLAADSASVVASLGKQGFLGTVVYLRAKDPPRASGYPADKFKAHWYQMNCNGTGPRNAKASIEAGFYRIGY